MVGGFGPGRDGSARCGGIHPAGADSFSVDGSGSGVEAVGSTPAVMSARPPLRRTAHGSVPLLPRDRTQHAANYRFNDDLAARRSVSASRRIGAPDQAVNRPCRAHRKLDR
ncbi:hypothetical protein Raf01_19740 [Rugosimonospora africana]|uniref:Uncharacterized protein n=1 Tax=Rugosimonospora africana TaxID=556532 RepID=A0A8J3QPF9_9ACTN|nr:hypothetical protein Raf01_19740 [Rugosimonospora africana]